jgi:hypothetical protein
VALLGGLSMPKTNVKLEEVQELVNKIMSKNGKLIGLSYMGMFEVSGREDKLDFDCIIDDTLIGFVKK